MARNVNLDDFPNQLGHCEVMTMSDLVDTNEIVERWTGGIPNSYLVPTREGGAHDLARCYVQMKNGSPFTRIVTRARLGSWK
jgi:hypothetical protein